MVNCSGMIACACGNDNVWVKWSVECDCVCMRLDERMVSGSYDCDCVARLLCNMGWKLSRSQLTMQCIYNTQSTVRQRERRWEKEKTRQERDWDRNGLNEWKAHTTTATNTTPPTLHNCCHYCSLISLYSVHACVRVGACIRACMCVCVCTFCIIMFEHLSIYIYKK